MPIDTPNHSAPASDTFDPLFRGVSKKAGLVNASEGGEGDRHLLPTLLVPRAVVRGGVLRRGGDGSLSVVLRTDAEAAVGDGEARVVRAEGDADTVSVALCLVAVSPATSATDGEALCEEAHGGNFSDEADGSTHTAGVVVVAVVGEKGLTGELLLAGASIANGLRGEPLLACPPAAAPTAAAAAADLFALPLPLFTTAVMLSWTEFRDATGLGGLGKAVVHCLSVGSVRSGMLSKAGQPRLVLQNSPPVDWYRASRDS